MNDSLIQPALYVGDIDDDVDLNISPASGEDYIKRVVIEAKRCSSVVVAEIAESRLKKQTIDVEMLAGCIKAPATLSPTIQWQQQQIADFSDVRLRIAGSKSEMKEKIHKLEYPLLDADDHNSWANFCSELIRDRSPTLDTVFALSHPMVEQILEYFVEEMGKEEKIEPNFGRWVYALLAVIELPLNPDACSCLRTLARTCSTIRAKTTAAQEHQVNASNLFICLVARYFRQLDLADP